MKTLIIILVTLLFLGFIFFRSLSSDPTPSISENPTPKTPSQITIIAENLDTPWGIASLPDRSMLVTERPGRVRLVNSDGQLEPEPIITLDNVREAGEGGLLGITLHPDFSENNYVYLYYTYSNNGNNTLNRVSRLKYENKKLQNEQVIVDNIPGASNHNGGRIKFGPDNFLYITTGDAENPSQAQDINSLAGKILRVTDEGRPVQGNPFNNLVYSYGHRNPQGLAWDSSGQLWATEHGPSRLDEINKIEAGKNFGWPVIQGGEKREGMVSPSLNSGSATWAPAGAAFLNSSLFFGGLRGQTLYEAVFQENQIELREHFQGKFGRIRDIVLGPDSMIYITTSNKDGRGNPQERDDKIIKVDPKQF